MTLQELFNLAYIGLSKQGFEQSISEPQTCVYRGPNGYKCAIGFAIPDEVYHPDMDEGLKLEIVLGEINFEGNNDDARELQSCHDDCDVPEDMDRALKDFAWRHYLSIPQVQS